MIFAVLDPSPLTVCIKCSFFYIYRHIDCNANTHPFLSGMWRSVSWWTSSCSCRSRKHVESSLQTRSSAVIKHIYGRRRQGRHYILPLIFYFVSIDERPAMGSQSNLASRSEVMSIYKCPKKVGVPSPQSWGAKHQIFDHLFQISALYTGYLRNETSHRQIKMLVLIYNVSPKSWPQSVTIDPIAHCDPSFGVCYVATVQTS